jgi:dipeptidyl aminopeptidase/acylaminoacyl peptidase
MKALILLAAAAAWAETPHLINIRQLTHGGQNAEAYWSPDGKRLAFTGQTKVDGGGKRPLVLISVDGQKAGMTVHTKRGKAKGTRRLVDTQVVTSTLSNYRSAFQGNEKKGMKKKDTVSPFIRDERNYAVRLRQPDEYPPGEKETESRKMEVTRHRSAIAP